MNPSWFDALLAWITAHPVAAGAVIFAIAFCDAVIVLGAIVPALPLLFAVGMLIGLGELSGPYALACAALGAFVGDGLSFLIGKRWGPQLRTHWPFRKFPQLLDRGEATFRRNALKSILIARYVGPIRPFVPAIAGMLKMPWRRYLPASALAAVSWAALFLVPGWVLGQAYDAVAAVAGRLALVLGLLLVVMALAWAMVLYTYRWFATHADSLLARALAWSHEHPVLGRYSMAVFDPQRRESVSLALLAVMLLAFGWIWFAFLALVLGHGEPLGVDLAIHGFMQALRNPLADYPMAALASLGDVEVLAPASMLVLLYLAWRKRWMAAAHWLAAIAVGLLLTVGLDALVDTPRPPTAAAGFGFPSIAVTMTTVVFGFFAVLIAREFPGRQRVWPYLVAGVATALVAFARLYLGAHWLSDVVAGVLLGVVWLLVLGIAYRRHSARSFFIRPLAAVFYGTFALALCWYAPRSADATLAQFMPPTPGQHLSLAQWQAHGIADPRHFDLQAAGELRVLQRQLQAQGWQPQPAANWVSVLGLLDDEGSLARKPVLPLALDAHPERLLLRRTGADDTRIEVLRIWPAPAQLDDGTPLWVGRYERMQAHTRLRLLTLWQPLPHGDALPADLQAMAGVSAHADAAVRVRVAPR